MRSPTDEGRARAGRQAYPTREPRRTNPRAAACRHAPGSLQDQDTARALPARRLREQAALAKRHKRARSAGGQRAPRCSDFDAASPASTSGIKRGHNVRHERQAQAQLEAVRSMEGLGATLPNPAAGARRARRQLHLNSMALVLAWRAVCCDLTATGNRCHRKVELACRADATQTNGRPGDCPHEQRAKPGGQCDRCRGAKRLQLLERHQPCAGRRRTDSPLRPCPHFGGRTATVRRPPEDGRPALTSPMARSACPG